MKKSSLPRKCICGADDPSCWKSTTSISVNIPVEIYGDDIRIDIDEAKRIFCEAIEANIKNSDRRYFLSEVAAPVCTDCNRPFYESAAKEVPPVDKDGIRIEDTVNSYFDDVIVYNLWDDRTVCVSCVKQNNLYYLIKDAGVDLNEDNTVYFDCDLCKRKYDTWGGWS